MTATPAADACWRNAVDLARRHAGQHFVIVAAGEDGFDQRRLLGERRARRVGERHARDLDLGSDARGAAELGEIAGEPVGDVHGRRGVRAQHRRDGVARLRHEIAGREAVLLVAGEPPALGRGRVAPQQQPERGVADGAGHHHAVARPWRRRGAPSCRAAPRRTPAIEIVIGPGVRTVSPPSSGQPKCSASAPSPRANGASHASPISFGKREREQKAERARALGGEIGQIHPQRLPGDRIGRIVGKEMHAADDAVGREHEIAARGRRDRGGIVDRARRRRDASRAA